MAILVRPVREQLEHDRVIRLLQAKWKKKFDVDANVGEDRNGSVKVGHMTLFPDLVQTSATPPRRLQGVVEVETGESVNHLEALAQWTHFSKARAAFQLYVPVNSVDQARRLCQAHQVTVAELWSYYVIGDQIRFTLVHRDDSLAGALVKAAAAPDLEEPEPVAAVATPKAGPTAGTATKAPSDRAAKPGKAPVTATLARRAATPRPAARPAAKKAAKAARPTRKPAPKVASRKPAAKARPKVPAAARPAPRTVRAKAGAKKATGARPARARRPAGRAKPAAKAKRR